jgi:predicted nucleic acid-binding protein
MNAVDTNVLIYLFDVDEPAKRSRAVVAFNQLLLASEETILLWQVACEFLGCLRRWESIGKISPGDLEHHFQDILIALRLVVPSAHVFELSKRLSTNFSLSHWDSLLVAAAIEAGVDTLYTEDLQPGARYESLTVKNPIDPAA